MSPKLRLFWLAVVCVGALLASGCPEEPPPPAPVVTPPPRIPVAAPRSVPSAVAFDLLLAGGEPVLIFGSPTQLGGGIQMLKLTRFGNAEGPEQRLIAGGNALDIPPDAVEIAAAERGGKLAVAWLEREQTVLRTKAVLMDTSGTRVGRERDLGTTELTRTGRRGNVAVAMDGTGRALVLHRKNRGPCGGANGDSCALFGMYELGGRAGGNARRGVALAVPSPCTMPITGFAFAGRSFYYGLCAQDTGPTTTVYAIQFEPEYAQAVPSFPGCSPVGFAPSGDSVTYVADCGEARSGRRFEHAGETQIDTELSGVRCEDGRPVLAGESEPLHGARDRIGPLLPTDAAPIGSRALFTGNVVLIAAPIDREVSLRRYQCENGQFLRTDL